MIKQQKMNKINEEKKPKKVGKEDNQNKKIERKSDGNERPNIKQNKNNKLVSENRKKYLRKIRNNKIAVHITQISILVIFIVAWEMLANAGKIDSFITSQPSRIVKTFMNLSSNDLLEHLRITLVETLAGFSLGTIFGVIIAILIIATGLHNLILVIAVLLLGAFIGNYIQQNKEEVKEKIKRFIDKI